MASAANALPPAPTVAAALARLGSFALFAAAATVLLLLALYLYDLIVRRGRTAQLLLPPGKNVYVGDAVTLRVLINFQLADEYVRVVKVLGNDGREEEVHRFEVLMDEDSFTLNALHSPGEYAATYCTPGGRHVLQRCTFVVQRQQLDVSVRNAFPHDPIEVGFKTSANHDPHDYVTLVGRDATLSTGRKQFVPRGAATGTLVFDGAVASGEYEVLYMHRKQHGPPPFKEVVLARSSIITVRGPSLSPQLAYPKGRVSCMYRERLQVHFETGVHHPTSDAILLHRGEWHSTAEGTRDSASYAEGEVARIPVPRGQGQGLLSFASDRAPPLPGLYQLLYLAEGRAVCAWSQPFLVAAPSIALLSAPGAEYLPPGSHPPSVPLPRVPCLPFRSPLLYAVHTSRARGEWDALALCRRGEAPGRGVAGRCSRFLQPSKSPEFVHSLSPSTGGTGATGAGTGGLSFGLGSSGLDEAGIAAAAMRRLPPAASCCGEVLIVAFDADVVPLLPGLYAPVYVCPKEPGVMSRLVMLAANSLAHSAGMLSDVSPLVIESPRPPPRSATDDAQQQPLLLRAHTSSSLSAMGAAGAAGGDAHSPLPPATGPMPPGPGFVLVSASEKRWHSWGPVLALYGPTVTVEVPPLFTPGASPFYGEPVRALFSSLPLPLTARGNDCLALAEQGCPPLLSTRITLARGADVPSALQRRFSADPVAWVLAARRPADFSGRGVSVPPFSCLWQVVYLVPADNEAVSALHLPAAASLAHGALGQRHGALGQRAAAEGGSGAERAHVALSAVLGAERLLSGGGGGRAGSGAEDIGAGGDRLSLPLVPTLVGVPGSGGECFVEVGRSSPFFVAGPMLTLADGTPRPATNGSTAVEGAGSVVISTFSSMFSGAAPGSALKSGAVADTWPAPVLEVRFTTSTARQAYDFVAVCRQGAGLEVSDKSLAGCCAFLPDKLTSGTVSIPLESLPAGRYDAVYVKGHDSMGARLLAGVRTLGGGVAVPAAGGTAAGGGGGAAYAAAAAGGAAGDGSLILSRSDTFSVVVNPAGQKSLRLAGTWSKGGEGSGVLGEPAASAHLRDEGRLSLCDGEEDEAPPPQERRMKNTTIMQAGAAVAARDGGTAVTRAKAAGAAASPAPAAAPVAVPTAPAAVAASPPTPASSVAAIGARDKAPQFSPAQAAAAAAARKGGNKSSGSGGTVEPQLSAPAPAPAAAASVKPPSSAPLIFSLEAAEIGAAKMGAGRTGGPGTGGPGTGGPVSGAAASATAGALHGTRPQHHPAGGRGSQNVGTSPAAALALSPPVSTAAAAATAAAGALDRRHVATANAAPPSPVPPEDQSPQVPQGHAAAATSPHLDKYVRMLKSGVPPGAVEQKMGSEGMCREDVQAVLAQGGAGARAGSAPASSPTAPPPPALPPAHLPPPLGAPAPGAPSAPRVPAPSPPPSAMSDLLSAIRDRGGKPLRGEGRSAGSGGSPSAARTLVHRGSAAGSTAAPPEATSAAKGSGGGGGGLLDHLKNNRLFTRMASPSQQQAAGTPTAAFAAAAAAAGERGPGGTNVAAGTSAGDGGRGGHALQKRGAGKGGRGHGAATRSGHRAGGGNKSSGGFSSDSSGVGNSDWD